MMDGEESSAQSLSTPTPSAPIPPVILLDHDEESQTAHNGNADVADHSRADYEVAGGHEAQTLATTDSLKHITPSASNNGNAALALLEFLEEDRLLRNGPDEGQEITATQVDVSNSSDADSSRPPVPPREYSTESPDRRRNTNVESVEIDGTRSPSNSQSTVPTTVTPNGQTSVAGSSLRRGESESRRTEIVRARWQPDGEVTYCPICHTQFGWVVRKHHCRKCGRVVCGSCSTHRITIPYEYIARPPSEGLRAYGLSASDELALERSRTGGERVRLCNPCVPDPNVAPPQVPSHDTLYRTGSERRGYRSSSSTTSASSNAPRRDHRSSLVFDNYQRHVRVPSILQPEDSGQEGNRSRSNTMPARDAGGLHPGSSNHTRSESSYIPPRSQYSRTVDNSRPLPQLPPPSEDDICPVCHRLLTARTVPNYEELRAAHIISCIEGHSVNPNSQIRPGAYTSRSDSAGPIQAGSSSNPEGSRTQRRWTPSNASSSSSSRPIPNTPEARMAAREQAHAAVVLASSRTPPAEGGRQTRLFPYKATEKDCVDDAECTICLEEFEVGADMARLECFCRFHLHCIRDWWVHHHGRCPVHQHDGYGF